MDGCNPNGLSQDSACAVPSNVALFLDGCKRAIPVTLASAPFGLLFGVVAVDNGFNVWESVLMSAAVFAGASQLVGMELFGHHVAPWLILLSIFAVNFRHVLYSAGTGRLIRHFTPLQQIVSFFFLTDVQYAETEKRSEQKLPVNFVWYMGLALPLYLMWVFEAYLGATFGGMIGDPKAIGLDMLLPIYFLGLVMGFRSRTNWLPIVLASSVTSVAAFFLIGSPWHVSIGAIGGIAVAVLIAKPASGRETVITLDDVVVKKPEEVL
ncbi:AzlC family ABC transporter permease [Pseudochrobactrum sp. MP213Fo]|uniref:AzlC family ABC transporter permease n=1 Tax=Pseudochrobactrum sp. MP213Fo TaxID=3022250 RepID=UPI003B9F26F2